MTSGDCFGVTRDATAHLGWSAPHRPPSRPFLSSRTHRNHNLNINQHDSRWARDLTWSWNVRHGESCLESRLIDLSYPDTL
jgi:hypothetical protein